jgi:hypothetical protein
MTSNAVGCLSRGALALLRAGVLAAPLALASMVPALAGPPFLTDDPEPVPHKHFELYTFRTSDTSNGGRAVSGPALEFNAGILPNVQFHLVAPYAAFAPPDLARTSGYGDTEVGLKVRFVQETATRPQIGIFPMAEIATGDASRGLGNGRTWYRLPIWVQKSWGPWKTYGGGGVALNNVPGAQNYGFAGWLIQRDLSSKFTLGGEVFTQGPNAVGGRGSTYYNVGGYYNPTTQLNVLFSIGHTFIGERHAVQYFGLYYTFPRPAEDATPAEHPTLK